MAVVSEEYSERGVMALTPTDDLLTAEVVEELRRGIDSTATKRAVIDLGAIRSLVSGSLYPRAEPITPLLRLHKQLLVDARRLMLCNLSSEVAEVFRISRLDGLFEVYKDLETVLSNAVGESVE